MKILIIEDNQDIQTMLVEAIGQQGHQTVSAYSGTEGLLLLQLHAIDLVILDLMLPGKSGQDVLREIKSHSVLPVIVISAMNSMDEKIALLKAGADDYLDKPFNLRELMARIDNAIKHYQGSTSKAVYQIEHLVYDSNDHRMTYKQQELNFTPQEFKIMSLFMQNPNKIFTKQELFELAWDSYYIGEDKTLNVHIGNIRKKLFAVSERDWIETVWGIGFRLNPQINTAD
ncbi:response regulator transcription factor [Fundicoccus culcitae]|uniref:Response regulator transcription factor n=1 Tax=Fundicoccus culcitae TaxID=2969821 RepID=A0ABY5P873_9LACT|nr:response regulator transcription factor [Fundicoccus culcitae]UUX34937.1 response regulator transcription factor [Fundicoccus culcitae]